MSDQPATAPHHRLRAMVGRPTDEPHRASTPLELLFDLTIVVAFAQAGAQLAHLLQTEHTGAAIGAFAFAVFGICWAWINYSWLASAFDNDDVIFRLATMVQMVGVLVLALGLPQLFASIGTGAPLDNSVLVAGYVIMRLSTLGLWLRVARHNRRWRRTAGTYAALIAVAQVGWIVQIVIFPSITVTVIITVVLALFEVSIPMIAERIEATPWHPHHVAERYSLLVIITLGEVIAGTITEIGAVHEKQGWSLEAGLVALGGVALALGLWWVYFTMPSGDVHAQHRERSFVWRYGHVVLCGALAASGAVVHVAAFVIQGEASIGPTAAALTLAVPVAIFTIFLFVLYSLLLGELDTFHLLLLLGALLVLAAAVGAVAVGASLGVGTLITACSMLVVVVGYETVGHRHQDQALRRALQPPAEQ